MNLSKNWYAITNESGQHRVRSLLQELNIGTPINSLIYVKFGYKILSAQDKETYYFLRDISELNQKKTNRPVCHTNLDYLSISLGTSESAQHHRIKKLEKYNLLKILANGDYYIFDSPYPDSTFVNTTVKLIRRRRLGELIRLHDACNNPSMRIEYLTEINKLNSMGVSHTKKETLSSFNSLEDNFDKGEKEESTIGLIQTLAKMSNFKSL